MFKDGQADRDHSLIAKFHAYLRVMIQTESQPSLEFCSGLHSALTARAEILHCRRHSAQQRQHVGDLNSCNCSC